MDSMQSLSKFQKTSLNKSKKFSKYYRNAKRSKENPTKLEKNKKKVGRLISKFTMKLVQVSTAANAGDSLEQT
jgi:hypothetical protein